VGKRMEESKKRKETQQGKNSTKAGKKTEKVPSRPKTGNLLKNPSKRKRKNSGIGDFVWK